MEKVHKIFTLIFSYILIANSEKVGNFRVFPVYLQDMLSGPNATVYEVARANITCTSPTLFGQVRVIDDLITAEPNPNSKKLGQAQGVITSSDMEHTAITVHMNFMFTAGEYEGGMLCIVGRKSLIYDNQEVPIIGGTGIFRWALGFSISSNYSYDAAVDYGVLEYNFYVVYPDQEYGFGGLAKE